MHTKNRPNDNFKRRSARHTALLAYWTGGWVISCALATFGPRFIWDENGLLTALAVVANVLIGGGMVLANKRHLLGLDELQRKIQLDAMGLSLGVALVAGIAYTLLDTTGLIAGDAEISHLVIVIGLTYLAGVIIGTRRYR